MKFYSVIKIDIRIEARIHISTRKYLVYISSSYIQFCTYSEKIVAHHFNSTNVQLFNIALTQYNNKSTINHLQLNCSLRHYIIIGMFVATLSVI